MRGDHAVRVTQVSIRNFRGLQSLDLAVGGESLLLLGANGAGKTAVLTGIAKALGAERGMQVEDFVDPGIPVEITVTLNDLGADLAGIFNQRVTFAPGGPTLTIGVHAVVDGDEADVTHGFPNAGWAPAGRDQVRALPVLSLRADRRHDQLLRLFGARSLLADLIAELDLRVPLETAGQAIAQAAASLATAAPLQQLLRDGSAQLVGVLNDADPNAFELGSGGPLDMLRQLELTLAYRGHRAGLSEQPSGLGHLAIFAVAFVALQRHPGTVVLLDEPELSLHPHAQRAVITRMRGTGEQVLMATHSAHSLSRWDMRKAVRLEAAPTGVTAHKAGHVSDVEERRLARYATATLAEALFARAVVLVEGPGDRLALRVAADTLGVDLDARGVSIVELDGADLFATMHTLLGPAGLRIRVVGLCDADREQSWAASVLGAGNYNGVRATLTQHGVHVLDPDIEGELIHALGDTRTEAVVAADGDAAALALFRQQPTQAQRTPREQLVRFIKKGKARWPPLLMADLTAAELPQAIKDLFANV
jgi:hypothetical protein